MADIDKQWREILNRLHTVKKNVEDNYRASKKFFGSYDELITFITEAEKQLEAEGSIGADPAVLKHLLKKHKVIFLMLHRRIILIRFSYTRIGFRNQGILYECTNAIWG
jgi:hypothetical protein